MQQTLEQCPRRHSLDLPNVLVVNGNSRPRKDGGHGASCYDVDRIAIDFSIRIHRISNGLLLCTRLSSSRRSRSQVEHQYSVNHCDVETSTRLVCHLRPVSPSAGRSGTEPDQIKIPLQKLVAPLRLTKHRSGCSLSLSVRRYYVKIVRISSTLAILSYLLMITLYRADYPHYSASKRDFNWL